MATFPLPRATRSTAVAIIAVGVLGGGTAAVARAASSPGPAVSVAYPCSPTAQTGDPRTPGAGGCTSADGVVAPRPPAPLPAPAVGTLRLEGYNTGTEVGVTDHDIPVYSVASDVEQTLNIGSQGSGAGAGKIVFNPMSITIPADAAIPGLFAHAASGTPFRRAVVTLYAPGTTTPQVVEIFGLVAVKTQSVVGDRDGIGHVVTFEYGYAGFIVGGHRSGWNRVRNVSCAPADPGQPDPCIPS